MTNELLFIGFALILFSLNLVAFRYHKMYLFILIAVYSLLMNIFVTKQFMLFGLAVTGGNALYGAIFLCTDLLSEHYGKKSAREAVWVGFMVSGVFVLSTQILLNFIPNEFDYVQSALVTIFGLTPRILLGSFLAFLVAQHLDVNLYHWIKTKFSDKKWLFLRNNGSTMVSQLVDTLIFTAVGLTSFSFLPFDGIIPTEIFWEVFATTYIIKVGVAALDTPFLYLSHWLKSKQIPQKQDSI